MTTITLRIKDKSKKGKVFIEFLEQYILNDDAIEIVKTPNATTLKAMEEAKSGKVIRAKNVAELIKKLKS